MNFGIITLNTSMGIEQNCYTDTDSSIIHIITEDFKKTFLMMLKYGLIHLTMMRMIKDLFQ